MSIQIQVYVNDNDNDNAVLSIPIQITSTIHSFKQEILEKVFDKSHNDLEITNITEKIYKDYGLLFFDKGPLPKIIDHYTFDKFTKSDRQFSFRVHPIHTQIKKKQSTTINLFKKYNQETETNQESFIFKEEDFPSL